MLATRLNCTNDNDFLSYLKSPCPFSAYLYPTSPQEIIKLTNNLKLNKACGYDPRQHAYVGPTLDLRELVRWHHA